MKISIIVWFFDKIDNLKKTFSSMKEQNYDDLEIIIVDDCEHKNKNSEYNIFFNGILIHKNIKIITRMTNEGNSSSWNIAKKYASGKYIWFFKEGQVFKNNDVLKTIFSNETIISKKPDIIDTDSILNKNESPDTNKCLVANNIYNISTNKEVLVYMNMNINGKIFKLKTINENNINFRHDRNYDLLFIYILLFNAKNYIYLNISTTIMNDNNYKFSYLNLLKQWPHIFNYISTDSKFNIYNDEIIYSFVKYTTFTYMNIIKNKRNKILTKKSIAWINKRIDRKLYLYINNKYIKYNENDNFNNYSANIENYLKRITKHLT